MPTVVNAMVGYLRKDAAQALDGPELSSPHGSILSGRHRVLRNLQAAKLPTGYPNFPAGAMPEQQPKCRCRSPQSFIHKWLCNDLTDALLFLCIAIRHSCRPNNSAV